VNVREIVTEWLSEHDYDGLWCPNDAECGCFLDDLAPCSDESCLWCEPGVRKPDPDNEGEWICGPRETEHGR